MADNKPEDLSKRPYSYSCKRAADGFPDACDCVPKNKILCWSNPPIVFEAGALPSCDHSDADATQQSEQVQLCSHSAKVPQDMMRIVIVSLSTVSSEKSLPVDQLVLLEKSSHHFPSRIFKGPSTQA